MTMEYKKRANEAMERKRAGLPQAPAHAETMQLEVYHTLDTTGQGNLDNCLEESAAQSALVSQETAKNTIKDKSQMMIPQPSGNLAPRCNESFYPARHVLKMRAKSPDFGRSPSPTMKRINNEWLSGANMVRDAILQQHQK